MEPAGTIADRAYAPKPGAPARPAIVRCKKLASGWLAEVEPGETLLTQKRKHYWSAVSFKTPVNIVSAALVGLKGCVP
jgi:hypothetical protein